MKTCLQMGSLSLTPMEWPTAELKDTPELIQYLSAWIMQTFRELNDPENTPEENAQAVKEELKETNSLLSQAGSLNSLTAETLRRGESQLYEMLLVDDPLMERITSELNLEEYPIPLTTDEGEMDPQQYSLPDLLTTLVPVETY